MKLSEDRSLEIRALVNELEASDGPEQPDPEEVLRMQKHVAAAREAMKGPDPHNRLKGVGYTHCSIPGYTY